MHSPTPERAPGELAPIVCQNVVVAHACGRLLGGSRMVAAHKEWARQALGVAGNDVPYDTWIAVLAVSDNTGMPLTSPLAYRRTLSL